MAECSLKDAASKNCVPCESLDTLALLTREQVQEQVHDSLPLWTIQENDDKSLFLSRKFVCKNFQSALDCINGMGAIAQREGHHPDFHLTNYREVEICMWTHSLSGITKNDVEMCGMLDKEVNIVYSPKWLKQHPQAANVNK